MTIGELKEILESYDDEEKVMIRMYNNMTEIYREIRSIEKDKHFSGKEFVFIQNR